MLEGVTDPDIVNGLNPGGDVLVVDNLSVTNGTLTDNEDGTYTFRGDADFNGTAQLNYLIKDGQGGSISNTVDLTVSSVNDAPVATFTVDQNVAEGSSTLSGQLTATDVDTKSTNTADQVETKSFKFISAFIDDLDVYGASQASLSGTIKNAGGGALTADDVVSFVSATIEKPNTDTSQGAAATVLETKDTVGDIGGLTFDDNAKTWAFDASHTDYSALNADEMVEIIVEYKITNNGDETTNHFRLSVLPESSDNGTAVTKAIYATEVNDIDGLTINTDGSWQFNSNEYVEIARTNTAGALSGTLKGSSDATNYALKTATITQADGSILENQTAVNGLTITAGTGAVTFDSSGYTLAAGERLEISGEYEAAHPEEKSRRNSCYM